ncbi:MAG: toll/interleukin-1 receptor domain-containing protein [Nitrospirae bacterium]|nr:toll/interleukin-1 receptor domain-containing protein [Nitrospirota bacterium]MBF0541050.1 toll/interleukin-1 receptor domain-containing protein [Nitrospirota bacterium]
MNSKKINCIISHPWLDSNNPFILRLEESMIKQGFDIQVDNERALSEDNLSMIIKNILKSEGDIFLLVLTNKAFQSEFCAKELDFVLKADKPIVPIFTDSCNIPDSMISLFYADFRDLSPLETPEFDINKFELEIERLSHGIKRTLRMHQLIKILNNHKPEKRIEAAKMLAEKRYPKAVKAIYARLGKELDSNVIYWFAMALGKLAELKSQEGDRAKKILKDLQSNKSLKVKQGVLNALMNLKRIS